MYVIVGAGPIGTATANLLADRGEKVRIVTRSGRGPDRPEIERIRADATDPARLAELTEGASALFNCANPQYHRWLTDWPPLAAALLTTAERTGADLVIMSNLYGYGPVDGPITEHTPLAATHPKLRLRADMWRAALAAHEAGRLRVTEARASDYIEANSVLSFALGKPLLAGRRAFAPAPLDVPHSWTSTLDAARTLVTLAGDDRAWGRAWPVPTNPPLTIRQLATRFCEVNGAPPARPATLPYPALRAVGLVSPMVRELSTTRYQFTAPFVLDSTVTEKTFGLHPRPIEDALRDAASGLREPARSG